MLGACIYCGQYREINVDWEELGEVEPDVMSDEQKNRYATLSCDCNEAVAEKMKQLRIKRTKDAIAEVFENEDEIKEILQSYVKVIDLGIISEVSITDRNGIKCRLKKINSSGKINVIRERKVKKSREV